MPKAAADPSKPYNASSRPRKSHGQDKPTFTCGLDNCQWSSADQSTVSRHKWTHLPKKMYPRCEAHDKDGNRCNRRYFRLDDYKGHWKACHKGQGWVMPSTRERFPYLWQEYCEQRDELQTSINLSLFLQQALGSTFPQEYSVDVVVPSPQLPTAADPPAMPMRLEQAPAQIELVDNSLGLFGQDLFASPVPPPDAHTPLTVPPSASSYPAASFSYPTAFGHTHYSGYTPISTTFGSQSSSVSTSSVPIPPDDGVFVSDGAIHQPQARFEPFGVLDTGLRPSQVGIQDWDKWLAGF